MEKYGIFIPCLWTALLLISAVASEDSSSEISSKNGYIFTCPRSINLGAQNEFQFRRYGSLAAGVLNVKFLYQDSFTSNESVIFEKSYDIQEGVKEAFTNFYIPPFDGYIYNGRVEINGTFGDYIIGGSDKIYFSNSRDIIVFIQTDKPLYKDGQTVLFRVLIVDKDLKPVKDVEADIFVTDPKHTRLFQWKNESLGNGIKQFQFPLADEPLQGQWKISATVRDEVTSTNFDVKEYVLPKFDVNVEIPSFVLSNAEEIPITVCAKYTYGKPVKGKLQMNISLETFTWSNEKVPTLNYEEDINGCFDYKINVSLIENDEFYRYRRIQIKARVEESGTDVQMNETLYIQRQFSPLTLNFKQDQRQFFKPGLPYNGKLTVKHPDSTPAKDEGIQICYTVSRERILRSWYASKKVKFCKNFTSDEDGFIEFTIPPQTTDSVEVTVNAISLKYAEGKKGNSRQNSLNKPQTSMSLSPWNSPSGSFIQLQPVQETLFCGTKRSFSLLFTSSENAKFKFYYQVLNQGNVVRNGVVEKEFSTDDDVSSKFQDENKLVNDKEVPLQPPMKPDSSDDECQAEKEAKYVPPIGEVTIDLEIDPSWSPYFHLLVYYIRDDRQTVADSQKFKVEKCFKNQVKLQFGDTVKQPATKTSIRVSASPGSLCGIKVVDKSVSLLNPGDQLTKDKIFQILESFDTGMYYGVNHCNENVPQPGYYASIDILPRPPRPWSSSSFEDSLTAFENAGFLVISDLVLFTRPCKTRSTGNNIVYESDSADYAMPESFAGGAVAMASTARRPKPPPPPQMAPTVMPGNTKRGGVEATKSVVEVRNYFPETWLFNIEMTGDDGEFVTKAKLPHTITEWIGSAVCINDKDGLGISNKTSMKGFQAFFISANLPYSVVRGEKFWITTSVFGYVGDSLPVTVALKELEGFEIISESIDGDICVPPGTSTNLKIQLKAKSLGQQNITIKAETAKSADVCGESAVSDAIAKDAIEKSIIVEAEGWPAENIESVLFCPSGEENGSFEKTFSISIPEENLVEGSERGYFDVTGNVLGKSMDNLENLVTMPTGCGEQNMVKFAPNVVAMEVLIETNQLTDKLKNRITRNLQTGAQRQMKYQRPDGSFSAFGIRDKEGSMFLTAFVLRYFSRADKFVHIDNSTLNKMQNWIVSKQQEDGCFPDVGRIIQRNLQGGINKGESQGPITAYVLASLLISGYQNETILNSALSCIKNSEDETSYAAFLYSYVEALADKQESAQTRISAAKERAIVKGGTESYHDINGTKSQDLETAAYAILSILKSGGSIAEAFPIVQFLVQNMNRRGGFYSTQDTCVGLEALGEFAKLTFKDPVDITITATGGLEDQIKVLEDEKLIVKRYRIPKVPSDVDIVATGNGCAVIQSIQRYNTETPPEKRDFEFGVTGECLDEKCKRSRIFVAVNYIPEGKKTGMALVEVKMITGKVPVSESLETLLKDTNLKLMRFDVENNNVIFYFNEITNDVKHFAFEVEEIVAVENSRPGSAKVYDYYNRDLSSSTSYTIGKCEGASCSKEL